MSKYFRDLWPTWQQYRQWSMPSKLTFIGTYVGIFSLLITIATLVVTSLLKTTIDEAHIHGKWDKEKVNEIVLALMNQYGDLKEYGLECGFSESCKISHKIIDHYALNYVDKIGIVVVGYTKPDIRYDCHACAPKLSFVEFIKAQNGWNLKEAYINAFQDGSWGEPPSSIKLLAVGHDIFGVVVEHGYMGQGYLKEYTSIHTMVAGEFREIFSEITGVDDSGTGRSSDSWSSVITFRQRGTSFYDMVMQQTGKKDGNPLSNKVVYKFDGRKYSSSNIYQ